MIVVLKVFIGSEMFTRVVEKVQRCGSNVFHICGSDDSANSNGGIDPSPREALPPTDPPRYSTDPPKKGNVQHLLLNESPTGGATIASIFTPDESSNSNFTNTSTYRRVQCDYPVGADPVAAGFVLPPKKLLGQWLSTAIAGNDLTSSIIFTSGLVTELAGYYAPLCLAMVAALLYFFRSIYTELVTALPLNGGTYTGLLNTTRKGAAVAAACLSFLSYVATAVVGANSAVLYIQMLWPNLHTVVGTVVILVAFGIIRLMGVKQSSIMSTVILLAHLVSLALLSTAGFAYGISTKFAVIKSHFADHPGPKNPFGAIIMGFATAMLGITGFETTANFVQEQKTGVFRKTLRNVWIMVIIINPAIMILTFVVIPHEVMYLDTGNETDSVAHVTDETRQAMLGVMAKEMQKFVNGRWLQVWIIVDAALVLMGSVLTAYVGVSGLLKRLAMDDVLPRGFEATLPITKANYPPIILFGSVTVSMALVTWGNIESLSGVFTIAFLSVMFLFCLCNIMLKNTRRELKTEEKANWWVVVTCMMALIVALTANCFSDPIIFGYTVLYASIFMVLFMTMFSRTFVIRGTIGFLSNIRKRPKWVEKFATKLQNLLNEIERKPVVFFSRRLNIREMNVAVQRVLADELTRHLYIVHVYHHLDEIPDNLAYTMEVVDCLMYPNIKIDVLLIQGKFCPGIIRLVEKVLEIPSNRMFIAAPSRDLPYNVAELGSVRIIMSRDDREMIRPRFIHADTSVYPLSATEMPELGNCRPRVIPRRYRRSISVSPNVVVNSVREPSNDTVVRRMSTVALTAVHDASHSFVNTFTSFAATSGIAGFSLITFSACFFEKIVWILLIAAGAVLTTRDIAQTFSTFYTATVVQTHWKMENSLTIPAPLLCVSLNANISVARKGLNSTGFQEKNSEFLSGNICELIKIDVIRRTDSYSLCGSPYYTYYGPLTLQNDNYLCVRTNVPTSSLWNFDRETEKLVIAIKSTARQKSYILDFDHFREIPDLKRSNAVYLTAGSAKVTVSMKQLFTWVSSCESTKVCHQDCLTELYRNCRNTSLLAGDVGHIPMCFNFHSVANYHSCRATRCSKMCEQKVLDIQVHQTGKSFSGDSNDTEIEIGAGKFDYEEITESFSMDINSLLVTIGGNLGGSWLGISSLALCHIPVYIGRLLYIRWSSCGEIRCGRVA